MFIFHYKKAISIAVCIILLGILYLFTISSPYNYPNNSFITIRVGAGLYEVANTLEENNVIRSSFWFRTAAIVMGGERALKAGDYYISRRENALKIAWRIVNGKKDIETIRITIPEGFTNEEIAGLFDDRFPKFNKEEFLQTAREGYLFPDTYFVEVSATASSTINLLEKNFDQKLSDLLPEIASSTLSFVDVITLASILEEEANTDEDRKIVSGILHKRLNTGMPLQVDATLRYVTGRSSAELLVSDLESDNPYNTYRYKGFPPTPISNPGKEAIEAALRPATSQYLYFLTDSEGKMHYSKTFEEHKRNKELYIGS